MAQAEIKITADTAKARSEIDRLNRSLDSIEGSTRKAEKSLGNLSTVAGVAAGAFAALSAGVGIREIVDITGRFTDLNSRLINATGSAELAAEAFEGIKKSARTTYQPLEQTAEVFLRNSVALNELGYTTNEQIRISTALGNAMAVSGAKGERAASALDAFQKSIATGKMTTDEFNRAITNAPALVEALAAGLNMSVDQLRKMAAEGRLTSEVMIPALLNKFDELEKKAKDMPATMSDGFVLISNSFFEFIGKMDQALGSSEALSGALEYLADNIELVIGFALGVGVAVAALTLKMMGLATATAIATGGLTILLAGAAGAAMAKLAKDMGLFAFMAEKAVDPVKEKSRALEEAAKKQEREAKAAQRALEAQQTGLKALFDRIKLESDSIGLSNRDLAIRKNIAEAARVLKVEEKDIIKSVRDRIVAETDALIKKQQEHELVKILRDLETERLSLSIQDKDQREIVLAIRKQELDFGRSLNEQERERLTTAIQQTQQAREQAAIANALTEATRQQTELEKIQRGIRLQSQLDPASDLKSQYDRDLAALEAYHKATNTSTADALKQRQALEEQFHYKLLELQNQDFQNYDRINRLKEQMDYERIQRTLQNEVNGMAAVLSEQDRAVLQRRGVEERQAEIVKDRIEFEKKSDLDKTQFAIGNLQSVFAALGAQNKKAFEASKALAIASALVNTYQGATKALATYPWPFGLIAAAAAVAAGLAQVSAIRSQQYSGRALGGPVMGGKPYIVGESGPELFTPSTTGSITRNSDLMGGSGAVNVNFTIVANDTEGFDQLLTSRRGVITQIISDAMLERGQRSMV
jgi:tape measure domain-containing protein